MKARLLPPAGNEQGFILVATIWILAAITLGAGFFALWSNRAVELTRQNQEDLQGEIDIFSTRSTILYLLGTRYMTVAGLTMPLADEEADQQLRHNFLSPFTANTSPVGGELPLDDRVFRGMGSALFSLQDESGLIGLNAFRNHHLSNLLGLLDVSADQRGPLLDKLYDYMDTDELHRLNGAEADTYAEHELPLPANQFLHTSWEARRVLDWDNFDQLWQAGRLPLLTTVNHTGLPNFNTAPALVLQSIPGINAEKAARIIRFRQIKAFSSQADLLAATGGGLLFDSFGLFFCPPRTSALPSGGHTAPRPAKYMSS